VVAPKTFGVTLGDHPENPTNPERVESFGESPQIRARDRSRFSKLAFLIVTNRRHPAADAGQASCFRENSLILSI